MTGESHSGAAHGPTRSIEYSDALRRPIRRGEPQELATSTWAKITEAIDHADSEDALALVSYARDETQIHCEVMAQWRKDIRAFLQDRGLSATELAQTEQTTLALLDLPDGTPFELESLVSNYHGVLEQLKEELRQGDWSKARSTVVSAREAWRQLSDRDVDWCCGLINAVVVRLGEEAIPDMWNAIVGPLFAWRYEKFDVSRADWATEILPTLLYVALESMRAYLSTPWRDGAPLELVEYADRWVIRFDPCGSGGRVVRGDWVEGTPSRVEPPYNFRVIEKAYEWTDGKKGVCAYCNHCQVLLQHMPMDRFGYPLRVVDPPLYPDSLRDETRQRCQWTMYKDPALTPPDVYERCGRTKPDKFGSRAGSTDAADPASPTFLGSGQEPLPIADVE